MFWDFKIAKEILKDFECFKGFQGISMDFEGFVETLREFKGI